MVNYTDLLVKTTRGRSDGKIEITVNVTNTGDYKGKQVVQVTTARRRRAG
ncbi:MAG: hypothetical protein ACLS8R_09760 [Anaeromassilibacillus sp.]